MKPERKRKIIEKELRKKLRKLEKETRKKEETEKTNEEK